MHTLQTFIDCNDGRWLDNLSDKYTGIMIGHDQNYLRIQSTNTHVGHPISQVPLVIKILSTQNDISILSLALIISLCVKLVNVSD